LLSGNEPIDIRAYREITGTKGIGGRIRPNALPVWAPRILIDKMPSHRIGIWLARKRLRLTLGFRHAPDHQETWNGRLQSASGWIAARLLCAGLRHRRDHAERK
jgi:hypothetical protein